MSPSRTFGVLGPTVAGAAAVLLVAVQTGHPASEPVEAAATVELVAPATPAESAAAPAATQTVQVDPKLPEYTPVSGVSGTIKSVGSDTMNNLMTLWAEGFRKHYPAVQPEIEGKGSSTAPPALIAGTAIFGPMSRPMKDKEIDEFEKQFGYKPTPLRTGIDMLAVYVHKDNPIRGLTLAQVDAIFSKTRLGGNESDIVTWGDVGLTDDAWKDKPISLYGRNSASGTYGFFKDNALFGGDFKDSVKEQPGSSSVVNGVANDKHGIGYSGIGYKTADVRAVPLRGKGDRAFVEALPEHAYSGDYPLSRFLLVYVNYRPGSDLDPLRGEFITYMFTQQGQKEVVKDGYYPVPATIAAEAMQLVGLELDEPPPGGAVEAGSPRGGGR